MPLRVTAYCFFIFGADTGDMTTRGNPNLQRREKEKKTPVQKLDDDSDRIRKEAEEKARKTEETSFDSPYITDPYHSGMGPYGDKRPGPESN